jgi:tRNA A-37 threonylcarbamoyl transferase component Bud32
VWSGLVGFAAMAPEVLGNRYEVGRPIGSGAMARVLEAWDRHAHRRVALKVLVERLAGDTAFLERLEREAQTAASLTHPNIATVHTVGGDSHGRFVVTELVDGPSLGDMLAGRGPLPPVGAARVAAKVFAAMAAAHERGVAHGHLIPANVLLAIDGQVKVTDFRLAQAARPATAVRDPAADLHGVGRCLAAMLTGREPAADAPIRLGSEVPAELAAILLRTAGQLESAYRSAADLGQDLDRFLAGVQHGAAAGQPDLAPGHDRSAVVVLARSPATELEPVMAATPPARPVASTVRPPLAGRRRPLLVAAGLIAAGLVVSGAAGLLGRQLPAPVTRQALTPASTAILAPTTSQSTTSRAPATTTAPTTRAATASPPLTTRQTITTGPVVGPGQRIVPDVVGLHRHQAADVLAQAQLETQMVPTQVRDSGQVQRVIAQQPLAGQVVAAGSAVTVLVGTRRPTT